MQFLIELYTDWSVTRRYALCDLERKIFKHISMHIVCTSGYHRYHMQKYIFLLNSILFGAFLDLIQTPSFLTVVNSLENKVIDKVIVSKCPLDVCRPHQVLSQALSSHVLCLMSLWGTLKEEFIEKKDWGLIIRKMAFIYIYISRPTAYKMSEVNHNLTVTQIIMYK